MRTGSMLTLVTTMAIGAAIAAPQDVFAARYSRNSAFSCFVTNPAGLHTSAAEVYYGMINNGDGTNDMDIYCPVYDNDYFDKSEINAIEVHHYDGTTTGYVTARVCTSYYNANGGGCGTSTSSSYGGTGYGVLYPSLAAWSSSSHYAHVEVTLPDNGEAKSGLKGWKLIE